MTSNLEWGVTRMLDADVRAIVGLSMNRPDPGAAPDAVVFRD